MCQIIVVDNRSTDTTASLIQAYPVSLAHEVEVQTSYAARNRGISEAHGDVLAFTDSDCITDRSWIRELVQPFQDHSVGVVGGPVSSQLPHLTLAEAFLAQFKVVSGASFRHDEPKAFATTNVAFRRVALDRVGIFDAAMPGGGDNDLAWRVQVVGGYKGVYVPNARVLHKHRSSPRLIFRQYQRYGFSEIVLTTLYRGRTFHKRTPGYQIGVMVKQFCALGTYCASLLVRLFRWRRWKADRMYLAWPFFCYLVESGHLLGKLHGLVATRLFRKNPYPTDEKEVRREQPLATLDGSFAESDGETFTLPHEGI